MTPNASRLVVIIKINILLNVLCLLIIETFKHKIMNTTNLEISKRLHELNFKPSGLKIDKCWAKVRGSKLSDFNLVPLDFKVPGNCDIWYLSFSLEDILKVLSKRVSLNSKTHPDQTFSYKLIFDIVINRICYYNQESLFTTDQEENESLADLAGRFLIKLIENNVPVKTYF